MLSSVSPLLWQTGAIVTAIVKGENKQTQAYDIKNMEADVALLFSLNKTLGPQVCQQHFKDQQLCAAPGLYIVHTSTGHFLHSRKITG